MSNIILLNDSYSEIKFKLRIPRHFRKKKKIVTFSFFAKKVLKKTTEREHKGQI